MNEPIRYYAWVYGIENVLLLNANHRCKDQLDYPYFLLLYEFTGKEIELGDDETDRIMSIVDYWPFGNVTLKECIEK